MNKLVSDKLTKINRMRRGRLSYLLNRLLSFFAYQILILARNKEKDLKKKKSLVHDLTDGSTQRSGYVDHYTESLEISVWNMYQQNFKKNARTNTPVFRSEYIKSLLSKILEESPKISGIVNIGCSYGWLENQIARLYPKIKVIGIDRSPHAMNLNRSEFGEVQNLEFIAADYNQLFKDQPDILKNVILIHINFGVYFLPKLLLNLYETAFKKGVKKIVIFEPSGISRITHKHYEYSLQKKKTEVFRGQMLLNNYPELLMQSGFNLEFVDKVKPPHPHPDFESVCFVGSRDEH